jgi:hypothetical protein
LIWLWLSLTASADDVRVGIFVGNNDGAPAEQQLLFASSDATKMKELFQDVGGLRPTDTQLMLEKPRAAIYTAFDKAKRRIADAKSQGHTTTLVFYYSGHGDEDSLHLGGSQLKHEDLRFWLDSSGADVRIAFLDACKSGAIVREKGASRGPAFAFAKVDVEKTKGTAILTSSAGSEASQEGRSVGGGFFTHFLHGALSGAADNNRDGTVTLTEAYSHVHRETAFGTRDTMGVQTPSFDFDLVGSGDVVLTHLESRDSHLTFVGELDGRYAIWDETRKQYVAEVDGQYNHQLALRPGTYFVHHRAPGWMDEAEYHLRQGETLTVRDEDFVSVSYEHTAAKGDIDRQAKRSVMPKLALRAVVGARNFSRESLRQQYVPGHGVGGIEARFYTHRGPYFSFDLLTGGGSGEITDGVIASKSVLVTSHSLMGVAGMASRTRYVRAGIGGRGGMLVVSRSFPSGEIGTQTSVGASFGANIWTGFHVGRFSLDLQLNLMVMAARWDEETNPPFAEALLASGYRF